ncbi:FMN-dependent NADH-azoreductase [Aurantimonas aggregata]|uniref:FMN dependent NADH:quinone oxidoreductase n=1 Tax=Aurantimonas aggregata TaxID=2047720 RepID=A0A6L9ME27_9HYPH|nr:NAD(P)H-dependent oxidoreductase [Aurantimonas aggregata]NDV85920.1 FMN-dependent NADH-azoreductase [Aurantimonas aggregata]
MSTVLAIASSALGDASVSNGLVDDAVAALRASDPQLRVIARDLGLNPVPHLGLDAATALRGGEPANDAQAAARSLSDQLIREVRDADLIVIGAPMYNFGITSTLKAWFDHLLRAGETFRYTAAGPEGLIKGKRALVIETRGGKYSEGPAAAMDSQEPHLCTLLGFIGISDVTFVRAESLAIDPDIRAAAIEAARQEIERVAGRSLAEAA